MRFNLAAVLIGLAATTSIASAKPMPVGGKWNDKDHEFAYKMAATTCAAGAFICSQAGQPIGTAVLASGGFCCAYAANAVTGSQGDVVPQKVEDFKAGIKRLGAKAKVGVNGVIAGGKYTGRFIKGLWQVYTTGNGPILPVHHRELVGEGGVEGERYEEEVRSLLGARAEWEEDEDSLLAERSETSELEEEFEEYSD